jgi:hypothetical protein
LVARHEGRMTGPPFSTNGPRRLKKQYQCTPRKAEGNGVKKSQTVLSY